MGKVYKGLIAAGMLALLVAVASPHLQSWRQAQQIERHTEQLQQAEQKLEAHQEQLTDHDALLREHSATLAEHGTTLDQQGVQLEAQGTQIERQQRELRAVTTRLEQVEAQASQDRERLGDVEQEVKALRGEVSRLLEAQRESAARDQELLLELMKRLDTLERNRGQPAPD